MNTHWTKEEIDDLKLGYEIGLPLKEIGNIINRTIKAIQKKAKVLKLKHPNARQKKTHKEYVLELKEKCPTIIVLDAYNGIHTKILHKCLICEEEHYTSPHSKLCGYGHCGYKRNSSRAIPNMAGIVYLIYFPEILLYKIGLTQNTLKIRMKGIGHTYKVILERHFDNGIECEELEKEWLSNIQEYKVNTGLLKSGNTETFRI